MTPSTHTHTHSDAQLVFWESVMVNEAWNEESEMLEHSFPREPLQRTDTDQAKIDQDGQNQTFNLTQAAFSGSGNWSQYRNALNLHYGPIYFKINELPTNWQVATTTSSTKRQSKELAYSKYIMS